MSQICVFPLGVTPAISAASAIIRNHHIPIAGEPGPEVTHLLLDVPSFRPEPHPLLAQALQTLPKDVTILGGNLNHPLLSGYQRFDLLKQEHYIAQNAAITAHCALKYAAPLLKATFADTKTLILGWGRIGKCLARLLKALDCPVTVAARREADRCILEAMGIPAVDHSQIQLRKYNLLFNTVPVPILTAGELDVCPELIKIDLASGAALPGANVHAARGLPGSLAPESSGKLIAETILSEIKEELP